MEPPPAPSKSKTKAVPPPPSRHPLVTACRTYVEEATPTDSGYVAPRKKNMLDAFVTKVMIGGAADAVNAILIEVEMRTALETGCRCLPLPPERDLASPKPTVYRLTT